MDIQSILQKHRSDKLIESLLHVWEASVQHTHDFLTVQDIVQLRPCVVEGLRRVPILVVARGHDAVPCGFMGIAEKTIEMLFISPAFRQQGLGRCLIHMAQNDFGATDVDVNEQNAQGVGFYLHMDFEIIGRSSHDNQGRPFPLLHLRAKAKML